MPLSFNLDRTIPCGGINRSSNLRGGIINHTSYLKTRNSFFTHGFSANTRLDSNHSFFYNDNPSNDKNHQIKRYSWSKPLVIYHLFNSKCNSFNLRLFNKPTAASNKIYRCPNHHINLHRHIFLL